MELIGERVRIRHEPDGGTWTDRTDGSSYRFKNPKIFLKDVEFIIDRDLQNVAKLTKSFTVHAWAVGTVCLPEEFHNQFDNGLEVFYNPRKMSDFEDEHHRIVHGADVARIIGKRVTIKGIRVCGPSV